MILDVLKGLLSVVWTLAKWPLIITGAFILVMFILTICWTIYFRMFKGMHPVKGEHYKVKKENIFKRIFYLAPRQFAIDRINRNPEFFRHQGLIIYTGNQGSGKTSSMIHDIMLMQAEYPKVKVMTNMAYKHEDETMGTWEKMVDYNNGVQGVIVAIDEIQNWFNSKDSKNFPPEMTQTVTTNRKNRRVIMGTAQRFYMVAKDIRTQCSEVRHCYTIGGVFTIVIRRVPIIDSQGECKEEKFKGIYCWVHSPEVRDSYDTYKVIETLRKAGFKEESEQYRLDKVQPNNIVINVDKNIMKK